MKAKKITKMSIINKRKKIIFKEKKLKRRTIIPIINV